ncbi:MAG TPA: methyltransferase domain-containing protein [Casimicrobiaceae bacterium]|nr:methyltransferase domain-containing protein [Casimicrobiaceae bacterium]
MAAVPGPVALMAYRRRFDPDGHDSLAKLARWVRPGAAVLELGAAIGYFTEHLQATGCTVDIVEVDPQAAAEASRFARRTVVADLDGDAWLGELGDARYDAIVCADVLEHLRDGVKLLRRLQPLLREGGELLVSVPNVAHSAIIARLLDERFEYGGEGLLDATHVHLYTWRTLADALREAGFRVEAWDATTLSTFDTEFRVRTEGLAPALRAALERRPHAMVYQWLVRAVPGEGEAEAPAATAAPSAVPVRLLHAAVPDDLTLDHAPTRMLPIGGAPTALDGPLTAGTGALRLLLADRPGLVRVDALALHAEGTVLWSLDAEGARLVESDRTVPVRPRTYALIAADAWIAPDVPPKLLARADRLTARLAWPGSIVDTGAHVVFEALVFALEAERDAARSTHDELARLVSDLESRTAAERHEQERMRSLLEEARFACDAAREALAERDRAFAQIEDAVAAFRRENERLEKAAAAQERIIGYRQSLRWWLKLPLVRARLAWQRLTGS